MNKLYSLLFLVFLVGCSASGPLFKEINNINPDQAVIYVYHPKDYTYGSSEADFLYFNEEKVFRFTHGGYTYFLVPPGKHKIDIHMSTFFIPTGLSKGSITIEALAGGSYYVKYEEKLGDVLFYGNGASGVSAAHINEVDALRGKAEIASMRYMPHDLND